MHVHYSIIVRGCLCKKSIYIYIYICIFLSSPLSVQFFRIYYWVFFKCVWLYLPEGLLAWKGRGGGRWGGKICTCFLLSPGPQRPHWHTDTLKQIDTVGGHAAADATTSGTMIMLLLFQLLASLSTIRVYSSVAFFSLPSSVWSPSHLTRSENRTTIYLWVRLYICRPLSILVLISRYVYSTTSASANVLHPIVITNIYIVFCFLCMYILYATDVHAFVIQLLQRSTDYVHVCTCMYTCDPQRHQRHCHSEQQDIRRRQ